jgi:hypothetical protein
VPAVTGDLGNGDDTFVAVADVPSGLAAVAVTGGAGRDNILVSLAFDPQSAPYAQAFVRLGGGAGDDVMHDTYKGAQPAFMKGTLLGDEGNDHLTVTTDLQLPAEQSSDLPVAQSDLYLDGGPGDDVELAQFMGGQPAFMNCAMLGHEGNDRLTAITYGGGVHPPPCCGPGPGGGQSDLYLGGGLGNDVLTYEKHGAVAHNATANLDGGQGDDTIAVLVQYVPVQQDSIPDQIIDEYIDMDGGAGNDRLIFTDLPEPGFQTVLGYDYVLTMHGGAGNDFLYADASYFNGGGHTGSILEYGDGGDDALTLLYAGPSTTLLMDGGPGTDTGLSPSQHTPNVTVVNCEL